MCVCWEHLSCSCLLHRRSLRSLHFLTRMPIFLSQTALIYSHTYTCAHVCMRTHIHMSAAASHTHIHAHTYTHIHIYTYTHTYTNLGKSLHDSTHICTHLGLVRCVPSFNRSSLLLTDFNEPEVVLSAHAWRHLVVFLGNSTAPAVEYIRFGANFSEVRNRRLCKRLSYYTRGPTADSRRHDPTMTLRFQKSKV